MQLSRSLWALGALAAVAVAQDSDSCDPQNDSNDDSTCTSSVAASTASEVVAVSSTSVVAVSSTVDEDNLTRLTNVDTNLVISTILDTNVQTSTLPESLNTVTTGIVQTVVYTSASVYTTNTLTSTGSVMTFTATQTTSQTPAEASEDAAAAGDDSDNSDASASESGNSAPMATAKYVYGGLAAGLMGVAAVFCALLAFLILLGYGTAPAIDAFFFGCSANTESGLNTVDVKLLKTGEQLVLYFFPIVTNLAFINIAVVLVRLYWFDKRIRKHAPWLLRKRRASTFDDDAAAGDVEARTSSYEPTTNNAADEKTATNLKIPSPNEPNYDYLPEDNNGKGLEQDRTQTITWAPDLKQPASEKAFRIPGPQERDNGAPLQEVEEITSDDDDIDKISVAHASTSGGVLRRRRGRRLSTSATSMSIERIASSMFVLGDTPDVVRPRSRDPSIHRTVEGSQQATPSAIEDREATLQRLSKEELGGIEYRSLWLLLKVIVGYFVGLHLFGVICLVPWIWRAEPKYREYLHSQGQGLTWWGFYSAQTMVSNLGFTLTPDSMLSFKDATWPMLIMTFLAFAGNTCYPIMLRLLIWTMHKVCPRRSSLQEPLRFLLDHPRRCYTLLFPGKTTWILFAILFVLNTIDVTLIIVLDLDNKAVTNGLPPGPRVLAALFQAASSRHTGTSTFNLANVNPAVQFSLLVMMYISIFPIAFSIRTSNTYEETSIGKYAGDDTLDESQKGTSYLLTHARNQLSFDLWWIMLGVFLIVIAESDRVADNADPAFSVFAILFEVVSGYGNVGLSLGYPTVMTSLSGKFGTFSKLVICAMMIRGRHRGLPYALDSAIVLPGDDLVRGDEDHGKAVSRSTTVVDSKLKRFNTY